MNELISRNDLLAMACFCMAFASDWCWTKYIKRAGEGKAFPAAWWSIMIYAFSSANVLVYTKNPYMIIPMLAGYFFGTFYAVKHDHKESK